MMGILRLPCRNDYWRVQERCWLAHTNFGKAMSRDRFNLIWRYLHLQDNTQPNPTGDKCFKIRWYINYLVGRYQSVYTPGKNFFSIIVPFKKKKKHCFHRPMILFFCFLVTDLVIIFPFVSLSEKGCGSCYDLSLILLLSVYNNYKHIPRAYIYREIN